MSDSAFDSAPPHDLEAERAVLGALLREPEGLSWILVEEKLRPAHFYRESHAHAWAAMVALYDRSEPVDPLTVRVEMEKRGQGAPAAEAFAGLMRAAPSGNVENIRSYARRVVELARLRSKRLGAFRLLEAVEERDLGAIAEAESALMEGEDERTSGGSPQDVADALVKYVSEGQGAAWPLPFDALSRALGGGLRRGQVTVLSGWSGFGKSVMADQIAETAAKHGAKVKLYLTEMTVEERGMRYVARHTDLPFMRLLQGDVRGEEWDAFQAAVASIPFGMVNVADWHPDEVAHDARRNGIDLVVVDLIHEFDYEDEADLRRIMRTFTRLSQTADCHVLLVAHLNDARSQTVMPAPVPRDLKGASALRQGAHNVMFVHRDQTDDGTEILNTGRAYFSKVRNGIPMGIHVTFQGSRMRFLLADAPPPGV